MGVRAFLAINFSEEDKKQLAELISILKKQNRNLRIKWVEPENLHLTLHFLGEIEEQKLAQISEACDLFFKKISPLKLKFGKIHFFPNQEKPRIIFLDILESSDKNVLQTIYEQSKKILESFRVKLDQKPWHAHVTLGRIKNPQKIRYELPPKAIPQNVIMINSVELMKSVLTPQGPIYSILKRFNLADVK